MSLRARVGQLSRRLGPPPGRIVLVGPSYRGEPIERCPAGLRLNVPEEAGCDPMTALTADQHRAIRPDDRVVVIRWVENWRSETAADETTGPRRPERRGREP